MRAVYLAPIVFVLLLAPAHASDEGDCQELTGSAGVAACDRAIAEDLKEKNISLYLYRGFHLRDEGKLDLAIVDFSRVIQAAPNYALAYLQRGAAYRDQSKFEAALSDLDTAVKLAPDDPETLYHRGLTHVEMGAPDKALADFDRSVALSATFALGHLGRGRVLQEQEKVEDAIAAFTLAAQHKPDMYEAYAARGSAFVEKGAYVRALADFIKATELEPDEGNLWIQLGQVRFFMGDFQLAVADLRKGLTREFDDGSSVVAYVAGARAGIATAADQLRDDMKRMKADGWPRSVARYFLGELTPEALIAAATKPDDRCEAHFYIAQSHLIKGEAAKAEPLLQIAATTCPRNFIEHAGARAELARMKR